MNDDNEFRIDVGRANPTGDFVRVVHLPSGEQRTVVGLNGKRASQIAERLKQEISDAIKARGEAEGKGP
jgi:hypothetical protein